MRPGRFPTSGPQRSAPHMPDWWWQSPRTATIPTPPGVGRERGWCVMHQPQGGIGSLDRHPARRTTQETDPPRARAPICERTHGPLLLPRLVEAGAITYGAFAVVFHGSCPVLAVLVGTGAQRAVADAAALADPRAIVVSHHPRRPSRGPCRDQRLASVRKSRSLPKGTHSTGPECPPAHAA